MRIIFVCHGNTCRSPMAEVLALDWLQQRGHQIEVVSAGVSARLGSPATEHSQTAMQARGLDLSRHRSRSVWELDLHTTDLVWCMQSAIAQQVLSERTGIECTTLGHAAGTHDEVPDPYGRSLAEYETTAQLIALRVHAALSGLAP